MDSLFYTAEELKAEKFYKLPKFLFEGVYKEMSNDCRVVFMFLKNRMSLSLKSEWHDEVGVYIYFTRDELCEAVGLKQDAIRRHMETLRDFGLIQEKRQGLNKPNKIYILKPTARPRQSRVQGADENAPIKTNNKKTEISKTNSKVYSVDFPIDHAACEESEAFNLSILQRQVDKACLNNDVYGADNIYLTLKCFIECYERVFGAPYSQRITQDSLDEIVQDFWQASGGAYDEVVCLDEGLYYQMIRKYMRMGCDAHTIQHFFSGNIRYNLFKSLGVG